MKSFIQLVTFILLLHSTSVYAYKPTEGHISIYGGPMWHRSDFTSTKTAPHAADLGSAGVFIIGDINTNASLEIGLMFFNKQYQRELNGRFLVEQVKQTYITMGYRRWLNETFSVSFTLGSGYHMGEKQIVHTDFLTIENVDTSASDTAEYGLDLALQTEIWKNDSIAFVLDTRYSKSLTPKDHEKADHYAALLAVQYTLQEKNTNANLNE